MTIGEFLNARLDEEEQAAKAVVGSDAARGVWTFDAMQVRDRSGDLVVKHTWPHEGAHIVLHDPARVLREIKAKRAIVAVHHPVKRRSTGSGGGTVEDCQMCDHFPAQYPCETIRAIASVYADHPDYRKEWAL